MTESRALLAAYATEGCESAFGELVRRYVDLVYSTAVRLVNGDRHLAEDVSQTVFADLAKAARKLPEGVMLGGWLHRHTCFVASRVMRSERRRRARERQATEMNALENESGAPLAQVAPILDEAIDQLGETDRTAILLRFFEQRDFRSVSQSLGVNEDAARMRVNRALGKLHTLLSQRGVTFSCAALGPALAAGAISGAPTGLAATLASTALASAAVGGGLGLTILKLTAMTKLKIGFASAVLMSVVATPLVLQHQALRNARAQNDSLRQQIALASQAAAGQNGANDQPSAERNSAGALSSAEVDELLRLRGEVSRLRREAATEVAKRASPAPAAANRPQNDSSFSPEEEAKMAGIAKMNYTKSWIMALVVYAQKNQGQFPTNFEQALAFLPEGAKAEHHLQPDQDLPGTAKFGLTPDKYEIVYQGSLEAIRQPQSVVVLREKEPWPTPDGGWVRTYAFADGHSEIHRAADGNFDAWEAQHIILLH